MPDTQRDFFISFNGADEAYAKAISDALRAEGFTTFFHPDDLEFGGYIPKWMNDALLNSRQMLALCTPEYMSEGAVFSEAERYARFWQDTRGQEFKLIPVVLKDIKFPPLLAPYKRLVARNTTPVQAAAAVVAALKKPEEIKEREAVRGARPNESVRQLPYVHTTRLPETGYERLVGRDAELERLDKTWLDARINILSLVAEGGAGKSALVNEWIKRMQAHGYPGAEMVLAWSFYSQGTAERATSAEEFLNWMLEKLGILVATAGASAKADAIAEAMMRRRVLLLLDGVEPLQHGPGPRLGQLKDIGLRGLLRRFAAMPPTGMHGLIVLTSRLAVKDIARWQDGAARVVDVDQLSEEAGAALLRDNGVRGTEKDLQAAAREFDGHPLALGLLASYLKETQTGDVRRRDHIRGLLLDTENPGHDHARRVMDSYEKDWLVEQPILLTIMCMVGLFDRPASSDCIRALRKKPAVKGFTDRIIALDDTEWERAVTRLREIRLLAPRDPAAHESLDAHPLVREWFSENLRVKNEEAWRAAHSIVYDHLRRSTREGDLPTLEELTPLYHAITHGCLAGRHPEVLRKIYMERICRRRFDDGSLAFYAFHNLGAIDANLAALSWFFEKPFETPIAKLPHINQSWVLGEAAFCLHCLARLSEAIPGERRALQLLVDERAWDSAARVAANLSDSEFLLGNLSEATTIAQRSVELADLSGNKFYQLGFRAILANTLHAAGIGSKARSIFVDSEFRQINADRNYPLLYSVWGYYYSDFLLSERSWTVVIERTTRILQWQTDADPRLDQALVPLMLGRAHLGFELERANSLSVGQDIGVTTHNISEWLKGAMDLLRATGGLDELPRGLLARSAFRRSIGDWSGAARDLDEVEEVAEPGPMRLYLCDMALERARLGFAQIEMFAPLNGMLVNENLPKPDIEKVAELKRNGEEQLNMAAEIIDKCGYHRRDEELAELKAVLRGERTFASLLPRV